MVSRIDKELKSLIKFIEYLKKDNIDPNKPVVKRIIKSSLIICHQQGGIDYLKKELKKK